MKTMKPRDWVKAERLKVIIMETVPHICVSPAGIVCCFSLKCPSHPQVADFIVILHIESAFIIHIIV